MHRDIRRNVFRIYVGFTRGIWEEGCTVHFSIRQAFLPLLEPPDPSPPDPAPPLSSFQPRSPPGKIFAKSYGKFQAFKQYIDEVLVSLARRVRLPDAEFVFNLGDWPQANTTASGLPVLSWCGSNDTDDVVLPTYKSTLSTLYGKDMENIRDVDARCYRQGGWGKKIKKVFWRGRDSNPIRTKFVDEIGAYNLQYVDANISKNHFNYYPSEEVRAAMIIGGTHLNGPVLLVQTIGGLKEPQQDPTGIHSR